MFKISTCPMCGGKNIKAVRRTIRRNVNGRQVSIPSVRFHECPDCGEQFFPPESIDRIQAHLPAFRKPRPAVPA